VRREETEKKEGGGNSVHATGDRKAKATRENEDRSRTEKICLAGEELRRQPEESAVSGRGGLPKVGEFAHRLLFRGNRERAG